MWGRIARHIGGRLDSVTVVKITSHLSRAEARARGFSSAAWAANDRADKWAEDAAQRQQFSQRDVEVVGRLDATCKIALQRMLAVGRVLLDNAPAAVRNLKPNRVPLRDQASAAGKDQRHVRTIVN